MFCTYILQSETHHTYYVGSTSDVSKRLISHNSGASRYTRARKPWKIVYVEQYSTLNDARRREREIKQRKSRPYIEQLISQKPV